MATKAPVPGQAPRLRLTSSGGRRTLLHGGWWPRSRDPEVELPALIPAIDTVRGPITGLILSARAWDSRPRRINIGNRVLRLNFFATQPDTLLIAMCGKDARVDLLVVPPDAEPEAAQAALVMAATTSNVVQAQDILATVAATAAAPGAQGAGEVDPAAPDADTGEAWESEDDHSATTGVRTY